MGWGLPPFLWILIWLLLLLALSLSPFRRRNALEFVGEKKMRWLSCCFKSKKSIRNGTPADVAPHAQKQEHTNAVTLPTVPCQNHSSAVVSPARSSNSTKAVPDSNPKDLCQVRPDLSGTSTTADESTDPFPNPSTEVVPLPVNGNTFPHSSTEVVEPPVYANPCPDSSIEVALPLVCDPYPNSSTEVALPLVSEVVSDSVTTTPSKDGNENMPQHAREDEASESSPVEGRRSNVSTTTTTTNPWLEVDELDAELEEVRRKLTKESVDTQRLQNEVKYWQTCDNLLTSEEIKNEDALDWHSWFTSPLSKMDQIWVEAAESSSPVDQDPLSCAPTLAKESNHLLGGHPAPLPTTSPSTRPKQELRGLPQIAIDKSHNRGGRDGDAVMVQSILPRNKNSEAEDISSSPASISGSLLGGYGYYSPASESTTSWREKSPPTAVRGVSSLSPSLSSPALPFKGRSTLQSRYRRFEEGSNGENIAQRGGWVGEDCDDSLSDTAALYRRKSESIVLPRRRRPSSPSPQWKRSVLTPVENLSKWKCLKEEEGGGLASDVGPGFPRRRSCEMLDDCFIERSRGSASELLLQRQKRVARVLQLKSENNGGEAVNSASGERLHAGAAMHADARLSHWLKPPPVPKEYNNKNNNNNNTTNTNTNVNNNNNSNNNSNNNNNNNNNEYLHVSDTPENKARSPADSSSSQVHTPETSIDGGGGVPSSSSSIDGVTRVTDRPILGSVAAYWGSLSGSTRGGTWWDGKGIPNSTTKYRENQKVNWRSTPFEVRVDRELEKEAHVMQKNLFG